MNQQPNANEKPATYVEDAHKAVVMATLEDGMRDGVAGLEADATRNNTRAQETGDTMYERVAAGYQKQAEDHRASIDTSTNEVGQNYDDIMSISDGIREKASAGTTEHARQHRIAMEERLRLAHSRFGLIGSAVEPVPGMNAHKFSREDDVRQAASHARVSHNG